MSSPPKLGTIQGAQNRWDELQWIHIYQSNVIHGVGDCRLRPFQADGLPPALKSALVFC